jgi:penicillin G amidase
MWRRVRLAFVSWAAWLVLPITAGADEKSPPLERAKAVLAQLEGELALPGLHEPVEVLRDRWGVAHIYAANQDDLFFAQGVVAAQDRLFQMDWWRRTARGELAEVLGSSAVDGDRFARLMRYRGDLDAEWASYGPDARAIAVAFTRGINAYLEHLGDRLPIEFQRLGYRPQPWQPEDCLGRMAGVVMTRNFRFEIERAALIAAVGIDLARKLSPTEPVRPFAPVPGLDLSGAGSTVLTGFDAATRTLDLSKVDVSGFDGGSNNWVIDGSRSTSRKPLLANDPHRAVALPSLRYLVHLNGAGWNVIGGGEPALPGVAIGHNERIAWGITLVGMDQSDLYVEETHAADPRKYRVGDQWQSMQVVREKLAVRGQASPVEVELCFTRHGPVLYEDRARHQAYALRWVGSEPGTAGYLGSLALDQAGNWDEFLAAAARWKLPAENLVYADVDGNIGWVAAGLTPKRAAGDGLLPVPGTSDEFEWQGFLSIDELPQEYNPAEHYLATANQNITPPGHLYPLGLEWAPGFRHEEIESRLDQHASWDLDACCHLQLDQTSLPGRVLAGLARGLKFREPHLREAAQQLAQWDARASADSSAALVYVLWWEELMSRFFGRHLPANTPPSVTSFVKDRGATVLLTALEHPDRGWFGAHPTASRDLLLRETFARAVERLNAMADERRASGSIAWGDVHQAVFRHPLATLGADDARLFDLPAVPCGGDNFSPDQSRWNAKFEHTHGATYRQVFDLADWDRGLATSAPGQSGQPGSPHYADLLPLWQAGEYFPLAFSRPKVDEVTQHRLMIKPR